ncbi:YHS domain-containing (seleno)protein [Ekhidna sp.]|uniref:YHS domain-containing (seleno)protein n=1 Tax=Ekhidna sp. TaxID=2608089 RepID=UPI003299CA7A
MKTLLSTCFILISILTFAQKSPIYTTNAGAIKGYDPVAYFVKAEAIKGNEAFTLKWKEADWYFSSQENLDAFKADPEKYAPQFGGYCAFGVSKGGLYKIEPEAWKIIDGKLYLNYSKGIQKKWEANQADFIKKAETNWPAVIKQ